MTNTTDAFAPIIEKFEKLGDNPFAKRFLAGLTAPRVAPKGTMRAWMEAHNGLSVDTVQLTNETGNCWTPIDRKIEATRAGKVLLNDSARDYKGMRVLSATDSVLIVENDTQTIAYIVND